MTDLSDEKELNDRSEYQSNKRIWLIIIFIIVTVIISILLYKNSFQSKLLIIPKENVFHEEKIRVERILHSPKQYQYINEISIPYFQEDKDEHFSKFRCTGSENDIDEWEGRLCVFSNICYHRDSSRFHYFQCPYRKPKPIFYDSSKGMLFEFKYKTSNINFLSLSPHGSTPWTPLAINGTYPRQQLTKLHQLHHLMQVRFADSSIAHGLWEDLGSISYSLDRMGIEDPNLVLMHLTKLTNTSLFQMYHQYVLPALTPNPMVEFDHYIRSFNTSYVCFDRLILGGQIGVFPRDRVKENHGREALFYNWRSKIIQYNKFDPNYVPRKHHIIITDKSHSIFTRGGAKRHRAIVNIKQIEDFIKLTYPTISVEIVQWHQIPFNKQIEKLLNTTILITPCGGVSLILPFLPHGAHAIVMDFYVALQAHGYLPGQSGSMEGAFLNHLNHVRKQYYQIYGPADYEFDYPGATDPREDSSIIVNMTRLQLLIDKALEQMEPS